MALQLLWLGQPGTVVIAFFVLVLWLTLMLASKPFAPCCTATLSSGSETACWLMSCACKKTHAEKVSAGKTRFWVAASHDQSQPVRACGGSAQRCIV